MSQPFGPVQRVFVTNGSATQVTAGITTTSGNLLVAVVTTFANVIGTITDSNSNTWTGATASAGTTNGFCRIFYAKNITGGAAHTITHTPSAGNGFPTLTVFEIAGADLTSPLGSTNSTVSATAAHASGNITSSATLNECWIGGCSVTSGSGNITGDPLAWFLGSSNAFSSTEGCVTGVRMVGTSVTGGFTVTEGAVNDACQIAAFRSVASGGGGGAAGGSYTFFGA